VAKRQFTTDDGVAWIVWDVHPEDLGRLAYDRRTASPSSDGGARADRVSRRSDRLVHPELQQGWLCFQSVTEKRRLSPIPPGWHELPDAALRGMLSDAVPAPQADGPISRPSVID
jgi:hypothetical protein